MDTSGSYMSNKREVISLHVGQAGVQMGQAFWELCLTEHNLDVQGKLTPKDRDCNGFESFFLEMQSGNYSPRSVLVDLEPSVVDGIRLGEFKDLYNPAMVLNGKEDAANNYARGYYTTGDQLCGRIVEATRRQAEACHKLQGFMLFHSFGGGTGSGLNSLICDNLKQEFPKHCKLEFAIFPSPTMSTSVVEPYNAVLSANSNMNKTDCVILVDNEAMYAICQRRLDIDIPTYKSLNRLLAYPVSSITASLRFQGSLNADFIDFRTNLVPYPRIHFPIVGFAPIIAAHSADHETMSISDITISSVDPMNRLIKCNNELGCYMACCLLYRGDVAPKDVNAAINQLKSKREVQFVGWSPTGFKVGINDSPPGHIENGDLAKLRRAVCIICNTTAIKEAWSCLNIKYNVMLEKRAFCHWYTGEGMEEQEFSDAQDNLLTLEQDYEMLTHE